MAKAATLLQAENVYPIKGGPRNARCRISAWYSWAEEVIKCGLYKGSIAATLIPASPMKGEVATCIFQLQLNPALFM